MSTFEVTGARASPAKRPGSMSGGGARRGLVLGGVVLCMFIALALLGGFSAQPGGPASSSYATGDSGVAAWATLLGRTGRPVSQLRASLSGARFSAQETIVLLEPDALLHSEGARLIAFVRAGGRLVYGSSQPRRTLPALLYESPVWRAGGRSNYFGQARGGTDAAGVGEVRTAGEGRWTSFGGYEAQLRTADGAALLVRRRIGRGTIELLADVSPLQNRLLSTADNAQLALDILGPPGRPAVFVESVHGYGDSRGLAALPVRWRLAFLGLVLAGLLWIAARARRLGPAEQSLEVSPPARSAYADAIALLLQRTNDQQRIAATLDRWRKR